MANKIWIAEISYIDSGDRFLGAATTKHKAIEQCRTNEREYPSHNTELVFKKLPRSNTWKADCGYYSYCVFETEIDAED